MKVNAEGRGSDGGKGQGLTAGEGVRGDPGGEPALLSTDPPPDREQDREDREAAERHAYDEAGGYAVGGSA